MSVRINPDLYCQTPECKRPRETGRSYCTPCIRLARAVGRHLDDEEDGYTPGLPPADDAPSMQVCANSMRASEEAQARMPRCIAYLSMAGDVITLELTGEPKFTPADVEAIQWALTRRRRPESDYEADRLADFADDAEKSEAAELEDDDV